MRDVDAETVATIPRRGRGPTTTLRERRSPATARRGGRSPATMRRERRSSATAPPRKSQSGDRAAENVAAQRQRSICGAVALPVATIPRRGRGPTTTLRERRSPATARRGGRSPATMRRERRSSATAPPRKSQSGDNASRTSQLGDGAAEKVAVRRPRRRKRRGPATDVDLWRCRPPGRVRPRSEESGPSPS